MSEAIAAESKQNTQARTDRRKGKRRHAVSIAKRQELVSITAKRSQSKRWVMKARKDADQALKRAEGGKRLPISLASASIRVRDMES